MGLFGRGKPSVKLEYLGGHPGIKRAKEIKIEKGDEPRTLILDGKHMVRVASIEFGEQGRRSAGKAVVGAALGAALTGGIGLLAGAAIGGRRKDASMAVIITEDGLNIYLRCTVKELPQLTALL